MLAEIPLLITTDLTSEGEGKDGVRKSHMSLVSQGSLGR